MKALWAWFGSPRGQTVLFWTAHILFVVLAVVGLALVNRLSAVDRLVVSPFPGLNRWWLPLLFLIVYALGWLAWGLLRLVGPDRPPNDFADLTEAWAILRSELQTAGISLKDVPLFLVLGKPTSGVEAVFQAQRLPLQVRRTQGPLSVFANTEAIFVCGPGASLLPELTDRLQPRQPEPEPPVALAGENPTTEPTPNTPPPPAVPLLIENDATTQRKARLPSLLKTDAATLSAKRLHQWCRMLACDRLPLCPVNGIIALIPFEATATEEDAVEAAAVLRQDWAVTRAALQIDAPRLVVLADAHREPGFRRLSGKFAEEQGLSRLYGQNFPLTPDLGSAEVPGMIVSGMEWVRMVMLPLALAPMMGREGDGRLQSREEAVEQNIEIYRYIDNMTMRLRQLARIASLSLPDHPPFLAGCYLAGTGRDARDQAFVTGILRRAIELQNAVRWTPEALAEDRALHRYALGVYLGLAAFLLLVLVGLWNA
jgi:hypothetical protein